MKRKKEWQKRGAAKFIPEDAGDGEKLILDVHSSMGLGKLNLYECNQVLVDPDRLDDKLQDYEYESDLLVVFFTAG